MIWILLYGGAFLAICVGLFYLSTRFLKFHCMEAVTKGNHRAAIVLSFVLCGILFAVGYFTMGFLNTVIVLIHLVVIWLICDGIGVLIKKKYEKKTKVYCAGIIAILLTMAYLSFSAYQALKVWEKDYAITTEKHSGTLRVAMIGDAHVGTTFDGDGFAEHMQAINDTHPDLVCVVGDLVDDDTLKEDMIKTCEALGQMKTKYGVYYVYGNHDPAYFGTEKRGYTLEELKACLEENGVKVLCDETLLLDDRFYLIGRQDKSNANHGNGRKTMAELTAGSDPSKYSIVLDHQPTDYDAQAEAGVDLVLSGHTHGGQMLPFNHVGEWIGQNDLGYGHITMGKTHFIVTSGIGDWQLIFKSGCRSEFVVVDIQEK